MKLTKGRDFVMTNIHNMYINVGHGKGVKKYDHIRDVIFEGPTLNENMKAIKFKFVQKLMERKKEKKTVRTESRSKAPRPQ